MRHRNVTVIWIVAFALAHRLQAQLRDSAGVAILELRHPPSHAPGYMVEADPDLVIGSVTGSAEYLLTNPVYSRALDDGTIVIVDANRAHFEIRYYDADGRHLTTASRLGQGPCEFRHAMGFEVFGGDSVLVVGRDRRYAVFGPRGACGREGRLEGLPQTYPLPERVVDDTHLGFRAPVRTGEGTRPGVVRLRWAVGIYDMESGSADTRSTPIPSPRRSASSGVTARCGSPRETTRTSGDSMRTASSDTF